MNLEQVARLEALNLKKRLKQLSKNQLIDVILRLNSEFIEQQNLNKQLFEQKKKEEENEVK